LATSEDIYALNNRIVHGGNVHETDGILVVETPPAQWAYAVELPLCGNISREDEAVRLSLRISVDDGCLGIGILNRTGRAYHHEILVSREDGQSCEFEFVIGPIRRIGSLVIRNASGIGVPSRGKCRISTTPERTVTFG
jgi:hypothetical protein